MVDVGGNLIDRKSDQSHNVVYMLVDTTPDQVSLIYQKMEERIRIVERRLKRKLTLVEKILFGHLDDPQNQPLDAGESILALRPDRVAMQDATAQMALLQYLSSGRPLTAVPTTVHCDHLIRAHQGLGPDMKTATDENREVYEFLRQASQKCGIGFWGPGSGIIHQVVLEKYAFPGGLMIGTDSHTPNAGGLGMVACGVGGADAVDVMAGMPWEVKMPKLIGVHLKGNLKGWAAPKDIICYLCGVLTTKGGTNKIIEYFGEGVRSISCTGKATITNMGAELGATTSVFPFDERMAVYLSATGRAAITEITKSHAFLLMADPEVEKDPARFYHEVVEIDLSRLEPQVVGPHSPDVARSISKLAEDVKRHGWPSNITAALVGSCTNSSYEDIGRIAGIATQAMKAGLKMPVPFFVSPGSDQIFKTIQRDGQMKTLEAIGAVVLANACGPCIGQWKRDDYKKGQTNSIVSSFNRNFPARNDGNPETLSFLGSPEIVVALGLSGRLDFNPLTDELTTPNGTKIKLDEPTKTEELPPRGFVESREGYIAPGSDPSQVRIDVNPESSRLQLLKPFEPWDEKDYSRLPLLVKIKGKCTTDHISPAGPWLRFRGHLDNISDNMFTGAVSAFTGEIGRSLNQFTKQYDFIPAIAREYKKRGLRWVVVGEDNYGEGSSREHAAMSPRFLGAVAIIAKSFARIHETNLKKQGILPLIFANSSDYDHVQVDDSASLLGLTDLAPKKEIEGVFHHSNGTETRVRLRHSLTNEQIRWFRAGSALNLLSGGP